jgi:hypothetical protein
MPVLNDFFLRFIIKKKKKKKEKESVKRKGNRDRFLLLMTRKTLFKTCNCT